MCPSAFPSSEVKHVTGCQTHPTHPTHPFKCGRAPAPPHCLDHHPSPHHPSPHPRTHRAVDVGYVCSVCLSIFCQQQPQCAICGTAFRSSGTGEEEE